MSQPTDPADTWGKEQAPHATLGPDGGAAGPDAGAPSERYEVLGIIGVGGMGSVYRARDLRTDRSIALKTLLPHLAASPQALARFRAEGHTTARLEHPGIVPVYDLGVLPDGRPFYAMREIRGRLLAEAIAEAWAAGPPSGPVQRRLVDLVRRAAEAVAYAHAHDVVHRDLKPQNIMVGPFGEVLVLDWGLVQLPEHDAEEDPNPSDLSGLRTWVTRHGVVTGTPHYLSPEQARGESDAVGPPTDVWAFGAILYEVLTGAPPYPDPPEEALAATRIGPPEPPPTSSDLASLTMRCLAFRAADRPADATELVAALNRWLDGASRREEALVLVARASELEAEESAHHLSAVRRRARADQLAASTPTWAPEAARREIWAAEDEAADDEDAAALAEARRLETLHAALARSPELPEVREALARYHLIRLREARAKRSPTATRHEHLLRLHDQGRYRAWIEGRSDFALVTDPAGAEVRVRPLVERDRRRVPGPVSWSGKTPVNVELPRGSYVVELEAPGRCRVDLPVCLDPDHPWDTLPPDGAEPVPVPLPRPGELGPDDVLVPAGWARLGPREERTWVSAFVMRRHPVTHADYLSFLNDLVARGDVAEAERRAPRERSTRPDQPGPICYGRDGDGRFLLVPDAEGDVWDPDWPAFFVDWFGARAYAAWEAQRTGAPWDLPRESWWEKAARGVDGRRFPWGDRPEVGFAAVRGSREGRPLPARVAEVATDQSPYGVHGLAGNVREWCLDVYDPRVSAASEALTERVLRGSAFFFGLLDAHVRLPLAAGSRGDTIGFRLARPA